MGTEFSDDDLVAELADFAPKEKKAASPREERIIAGFEEIQRFVEEHGRAPEHGEDRDIFERLYAVRLDRLRRLDECKALLQGLDQRGLLNAPPESADPSVETVDDDTLMAELASADQTDITTLRHVRPRSQVNHPDEIASREPCKDFDRFQPLFERAERELKSGARETRSFGEDPSIQEGDFFILSGQMVYVANVGEAIIAPNQQTNARLRAIYSNGTESNLLLRSLERALYKDETGRRLTNPGAGPLFGDTEEEGDVATGTIYVLRSHSDHPFVAEHRDLIHKVGVTGGNVQARVANARNDATYLLADVDIVATYQLFGINRTKLENLLHRVLAPAQLDLVIKDRFGKPVKPREWFLVPLQVIDDLVDRLRRGDIEGIAYDVHTASLVSQRP